MDITEHRISSERHSTFYRACGPEDGPLIIMTHGWPELSISWRHQLSYLGGLGYRAIAPDMRGYGGSSLYTEHEAYVQREIVQDMVELIDSIGREQAVWIGHDWGSPVAWNVALHHPERVAAVASLCVPYGFQVIRKIWNTRSIASCIQRTNTLQANGTTSFSTTRTLRRRKKKWSRIQSEL